MASAARPLPHWLTVSTSPAPAVVDGRACRTRAAFFTEVARVLRFPAYFGRNWDALADCLRDACLRDACLREAGDAGKVTLIFERAEELLADEPPEQLATLLAVLAVLADEADAGLTVTLCTDPGHEALLRGRVAVALA
ncbi:barstar family protein [Actinomadura alba]|uniref:Barstar family protein n=1 Tax=Actinomadura alba TaxID=406431 RepID=A0ABR7M287_9ACTN|nr:barstar family protein [Actinomadura alba]MBC6471146.1 barstar family protein [Actinomadura alba]